MELEEIRRLVDRGGIAALRDAADDDVSKYLRDLLDRELAGPSAPNFDRLMSAGVQLARQGRERFDRTVLDWLSRRTTSRGLDVASCALAGLWHPAFRRQPVELADAEAFVRTRSALRPTSGAAYSSAMALTQLVNESSKEPLRSRVIGALREIRSGAGPGVAGERIDALVTRALERAGVT